MFDCYRRIGLAWVPEPTSDLARFGMEWTGWCPESGGRRSRRGFALDPRLERARAAVRAEGMIGLVGDMVRMPDGGAGWRLDRPLRRLEETVGPVDLSRLELRLCRGELAIVPAREGEAAGLVREASAALAGMRTADAGRVARPSGLRFRLSGPISGGDARLAASALAGRLSAMLMVPRRIGALALVGDPGDGRAWRVLERIELMGSPGGVSSFEVFGASTLAPELEAQPEVV